MMKKTRIAGKIRMSLLSRMAFLWLCLLLPFSGFAAMVPMADNEMEKIDGQALFMSRQETVGAYSFYRMGLDTRLELNANIAELKLGETTTGVDLWAKNVAFGCVANAGGTCVDSTSGTGTQLKPFTLMRPYVQIATKGANAATREVVGIRLGAESASGPLSIGNFLSFSGYLSATANITMQAQGTSSADDIAVTCGDDGAGPGGPCPGDGGSPGYNDYGLLVGSSRVDLQACKLEYSIVSPK